ncbi:MAG TPA: hypothetical protein VIS76_13110 [Pseudomonadales bacterium]
MSKDVVVLAVHGMGDTPPDFANELEEKLAASLGPAGWARVHFASIYYQSVLQANQERVMRAMRSEDLDGIRLRRFLLYGFSDAAGMERRAANPGSPYQQAQKIIRGVLKEAYETVGGAKPVVIIAQSLGCQVISNYLWDAQKAGKAGQGVWKSPTTKRGSPLDSFLRLKSLRFFYTTGCNIPIFLAGFPQEKILAVKTADGGYAFRWNNYYDEDDVLGWPLKPLSPSYGQAVYRDYAINANGTLLGSITHGWNALSHTRYWTDADVLKPLATDIRNLMV